MIWIRRSPVATCASRSVRTIPRWPCTRSATSSRIAFGRAKLRWSQLGFGKTSRTTAEQQTLGTCSFKDGTANILADDAKALAADVVAGERRAAPAGRLYLVARKIAMMIETWDRVPGRTGAHLRARQGRWRRLSPAARR
ncbi:hypothetical protein [Microbacterium sp.]|uniref:hypothetical protein n=1 Tax=Microbacterium sp. TaxID=51671 RepID=UPI003A95969E